LVHGSAICRRPLSSHSVSPSPPPSPAIMEGESTHRGKVRVVLEGPTPLSSLMSLSPAICAKNRRHLRAPLCNPPPSMAALSAPTNRAQIHGSPALLSSLQSAMILGAHTSAVCPAPRSSLQSTAIHGSSVRAHKSRADSWQPPFRSSTHAIITAAIHGSSVRAHKSRADSWQPPFRSSTHAIITAAIHGSSVRAHKSRADSCFPLSHSHRLPRSRFLLLQPSEKGAKRPPNSPRPGTTSLHSPGQTSRPPFRSSTHAIITVVFLSLFSSPSIPRHHALGNVACPPHKAPPVPGDRGAEIGAPWPRSEAWTRTVHRTPPLSSSAAASRFSTPPSSPPPPWPHLR
jgi:hypothetical protein